jgi:hypothetical protein
MGSPRKRPFLFRYGSQTGRFAVLDSAVHSVTYNYGWYDLRSPKESIRQYVSICRGAKYWSTSRTKLHNSNHSHKNPGSGASEHLSKATLQPSANLRQIHINYYAETNTALAISNYLTLNITNAPTSIDAVYTGTTFTTTTQSESIPIFPVAHAT